MAESHVFLTLPPGVYLHPGYCPACGGWRGEVDRVEGLPLYQCEKKCGTEPDASTKGDGRDG